MSKLSKLHNIFQSLLKYLVAAIILAVPLYPKFPFINVPGTYVSIRLEDFLIGITTVVWFVTILPSIGKFLRNDINRAILLFFAAGLVSILFAAYITNTAPLSLGVLHWGRRIEYMVMFFVGVSAIANKKNLKFYISCLFIVVAYAFLYGVLQKHFGLPIITTQNSEYSKGLALMYLPGGHLVSTFAGHYDMASVLILLLPIFTGILVTVKNTKFIKILILIVTLGGLWLMVNTASRISIVSFFLSVAVSLLVLRKAKHIIIVALISFIFVAFSTSLLSRYLEILNVYMQRVSEIVVHSVYAQDGAPVIEDRSTSIRLNVEWPRAIRAFTKNPLLGTGYSSITLATDNDYLRLLGEVGLLGFMAFALIFIKVFRVMIKSIKGLSKDRSLQSAFIAGMIGAQIGVGINAIFIDVFEASKFAIIYWLLLGITIGLLTQKDAKKAN